MGRQKERLKDGSAHRGARVCMCVQGLCVQCAQPRPRRGWGARRGRDVAATQWTPRGAGASWSVGRDMRDIQQLQEKRDFSGMCDESRRDTRFEVQGSVPTVSTSRRNTPIHTPSPANTPG